MRYLAMPLLMKTRLFVAAYPSEAAPFNLLGNFERGAVNVDNRWG